MLSSLLELIGKAALSVVVNAICRVVAASTRSRTVKTSRTTDDLPTAEEFLVLVARYCRGEIDAEEYFAACDAYAREMAGEW